MSTYHGIGTAYYGHADPGRDGSYVTTRYFVVLFLPVIPLGTDRVRKLAVHWLTTEYEIVEALPFRWGQIGMTYLRSWLLLPLLLLAPMLLLLVGATVVCSDKPTTNALIQAAAPTVAALEAVYVLVVLGLVLRRARRLGLPRPDAPPVVETPEQRKDRLLGRKPRR